MTPRTSLLASGLTLFLAAGCAHDRGLVPAPQAARAPSSSRLAEKQVNGLVVLVDGDAWKGEPRDLAKVITPIWVTVRNRSRQPARIIHQNFSLLMPGPRRGRPLPPAAMQKTPGPERTRAIPRPALRPRGAQLSPFYHRYYPGLRSWNRPFPYDSTFYDSYYARWRVPLPTDDMLRAALPERVLGPGGEVSGFLYFPDRPRDARGTFTFQADFPVDADGTNLAKVEIPLAAK
jgi:hypothetical protein